MSYPEWLNATLASDGAEGRNVLPSWISALNQNSLVVGPAFVVMASQDDNLSVFEAIASNPPAGCVLVVGGLQTSRKATIGGLVALDMQNKGIGALVTDGLVRDAREIREAGLPVWCRGTTPISPSKNGPGYFGGTISIGGTMVNDGDLIIADDDGVVVWPKAEIDDLMVKAKNRLDSDNARLEKLLAFRKK